MKMKYLLVSLSMFSLITFAGQAYADTGNDTTGANSTNEASVNISNTLKVTNTNQTSIDNHVSVDSNTGGNDASSNTGSGSITTGSSTIDITIKNTGNTIGSDPVTNPTNDGDTGSSEQGNNNITGQVSTFSSGSSSSHIDYSISGTGKVRLNVSGSGALEDTLVLGTSTDKTGGDLGLSNNSANSSDPKSTNWSLSDYILKLGLPLLLLLGFLFAIWAYFKGRRRSLAS